MINYVGRADPVFGRLCRTRDDVPHMQIGRHNGKCTLLLHVHAPLGHTTLAHTTMGHDNEQRRRLNENHRT